MLDSLKDIIKENTDIVRNHAQQIHEIITGEIDADADLSFNSQSKTAEWRLWIEAISFISYIHRKLWGKAKDELIDIRDGGVSANLRYFAREWRKFQYGDELLVDDEDPRYYYSDIDTSKQIIKRLSIIKTLNNWEVRVATEDDNGNPIPLSPAQLQAFKSFVDQTAPPGPIIPIISRHSDKLNAPFTVYYNALNIDVDTLREQVEAAYLNYISKIDIDGVSIYYIERHRDALQKVAHVIDVKQGDIQAKVDSSTYNSIDRKYEPISGYLEKDTEIDLSTLLTYIPE